MQYNVNIALHHLLQGKSGEFSTHSVFLSYQASSVHPLGRVLHQASVMQGTTASLGLGHPHQRMEG